MPFGHRMSGLSALFAATLLVTACGTQTDRPSEEATSGTPAAASSSGEPRTVAES